MPFKIGITGHRKLEDVEAVKKSMALAIAGILKDNNQATFEAYSSLATGSDSIFAEAAMHLGATLKVVLPMPVSEYLHDFDADEQLIFNKLLRNDPSPVIMDDTLPWNNDNRNDAYRRAGEFIANTCDVLIAVWDGEKSRGHGGTADIVRYARTIPKRVHHIRAFRSDLSRLFIQNDKPAIRLKNTYQSLWKMSIFFSLTAAIILAVSVSFNLKNAFELSLIELICIFFAVCNIFYLSRGTLNKNRIRTRRVAERLRVLERFDNCNINIEQLENFKGLPEEVIEVEKKYQAIAYPQNNFGKSRKALLQLVEEQIRYHTSERPEIKGRAFHTLEKTQLPLLIIFFFGVVFHFINVAQEQQHQLEFLPHFPHWLGLILSLSIPPVYAAIEGYIYFKEYHKIFIDSEKMKIFFEGIQRKIELIVPNANDNFEELNNYAYLIMKNMDDETKEWVILMETKKSPGP